MQTIVFTALGTGSLRTRNQRGPALYHLRWGETFLDQLVLECSADAHERLRKVGLNLATVPQANILVTHVHQDHFGGVMDLKYRRLFWENPLNLKNTGIKIWAPQQAVEAFAVIERAYLPELARLNKFKSDLALASVEEDHELEIGEAHVQALPVYHDDPLEALGFCIAIGDVSFAYTGDAAWPPRGAKYARQRAGLKALFAGADIVLCSTGGGLREAGHRHLSAIQAGFLAAENDIALLILTHINSLDSDETIIAACRESGFQGEIIVAYDGLEVEF